MRETVPAGKRRVLLVTGSLVLCAWCGWVSGFHRSTGYALATWFVSLAGVVAVDLALWLGRRGRLPAWRLEPARQPWPRPGSSGTRQVLAGLSPWLAIALVVLAWEVLGIDTGPQVPHLTISALTQAYRPLNAAMLLAWILVGIGYGVARARAPDLAAAEFGPPHTPDRPAGGVPAALGLTAKGTALLLPASRPAGVAFWIAVPVAALFVDLAARRSGGRIATAEELVRFMSRPLAANVIVVAAWGFAGYHLFAR